ncbi:Protein FAR1-RELATED SEQUENCE 5 [Rhynchospora pubera]|uniref:Protein FAR1-RELATED SEQUENCE 5 n=1 Tax=Rhynchospora pubera TaxID=906938 RepID=A0AAV8C4Q2_9POAL|nr:Protein FAR1-RELATED SEQUENCE 5 [Rhynchospora pubera]
MKYGAAIAMTKYFAKRSIEDSSFKHFEDTFEEGEISNVVWMDAKMIASYARFGDVVVFDTIFGTNKEKWAVGTFVGFNHLREIVVFGAALMCDQNIESFEWVFAKFLEAHGDKKPITIFTDQDPAIGAALKIQMYEEEKEFEDAFLFLMEKVNGESNTLDGESNTLDGDSNTMDGESSTWLKFIYKSKEKWAYCIMKDAHTLGIRSTQISESFNSKLKVYLNCKLDVCRFMEQFDRILEEIREKEITSEYDMRRKTSTLKSNMPIFRGVSNLYTTKVFELFQTEVELSVLAHIECLEGNSYTVGKSAFDNEATCKSRQVVWIRESQMVSCSCKKFERVGILCWHALKVLDREDIKVIPTRYILNRWARAAKNNTVVGVEGRRVIEDPMLDVRNRKADMVRMITPICDEAANNEEDTHFVRNEFLEFQRKYKEYKEKKKGGDGTLATEHALHLKKKNGGDRRSKRIPSCIEKNKRAKKARNKTISTSQDSLR